MTLRVGITATPYSRAVVDFVLEAERLGVESVWTPEFWGYDALTPLGYLAAKTERVRLGTAIVQLGARTPAMLAMSAMALQALSGNRFVLGLGTSGPQVMEGWHGVEFSRPVQRTRETIEIVRAIARHDRLEYSGKVFTIPLPGGEGRSIRSVAPPVEIPIYLASLGPANLALTGEMADGWIGNSFLPESADVFFDPIRRAAEAAGRSIADIDLTVAVGLEITDDVDEAARRHARGYAFTFGAMGSAKQNFYNDAFARQGFGDDVAEVQRLWLAGDRDAAADRVPVEIGLKTNLVGTPQLITERLRLYRDAGVTTLRVGESAVEADRQLASLATLLELVDAVNRERHRRGVVTRTLDVTVLVAALLAAGCGSDGDGSTPTTTTTRDTVTSLPTATTTSTMPVVTTPAVSIESVADFAQLGDLLPDLVPIADTATHVIELQLRTLEASVADGQLCLGTGDGAGADSCAMVAAGPGVLVYADSSPITPVYAIATTDDVAVELEPPGSPLNCYSEGVPRVGAMTVWWCEDQFPSTVRVTTPDGRTFEVPAQ